jgi:hypothetical protein
MSESPKVKEEKFDAEGFEKLKAAFNEYEAEQKERFKNFSVGLLKNTKVPQEANIAGIGWVKFMLLSHEELSDLAKFYKADQREFELQALLKMMKPCYPDLAEKDLRDAPWDLVRALEKALLNEGFLPRQVRQLMTGSTGAQKPNESQPSSTSTTTP